MCMKTRLNIGSQDGLHLMMNESTKIDSDEFDIDNNRHLWRAVMGREVSR
jgi:hypothetical protein